MRRQHYDVLRRHLLSPAEPLDHAGDRLCRVCGAMRFDLAPGWTLHLRRDLAPVETQHLAMERLRGAAVHGQLEGEETGWRRKPAFVDALVVVEEEPDRPLLVVAQ